MKLGSFCTGIGGLDIAVEQVFGATPVWFCEYDPAPSKVLAHNWPDVPNHGDLTDTDWSAVEPVDIVTAGFPCQPASSAGLRLGRLDDRWIWPLIANAIKQLEPSLVVLENVRGLLSLNSEYCHGEDCPICDPTEEEQARQDAEHNSHNAYLDAISENKTDGRSYRLPERRKLAHTAATTIWTGLGEVFKDLANLGFDAEWGTTRSSDIGAPHRRERLFVVAHHQRHSAPADTADIRQEWPGATRPRWDGFTNDYLIATDSDGPGTDWGKYTAAIRRWEAITGTAAPDPLVDGKSLNPALPEWMLGYPTGWVTDPAIGLTRAQQLKAIGNSVQSQAAFVKVHELAVRAGLLQAVAA